MAMPDRRYTFDVRRRDTDISEVVEAYLLHQRRPSVRAVFDHFYRYVEVDSRAIWAGLPGHDDPPWDAETALAFATIAAAADSYLDTHCWVFSDATFITLMSSLMHMEIITMPFVAFRPTRPGEHEFFVTLERLSDEIPSAQCRDLCLASLKQLPASGTSTNAGLLATASSVPGYVLSDREVAMIEAKRRTLARIRGAVRFRRRR